MFLPDKLSYIYIYIYEIPDKLSLVSKIFMYEVLEEVIAGVSLD